MKKSKGIQAGNRKSLIFYIVLMAIPTIQFVLFYVCVNFNSFLLAFKHYTTTDHYEINLTKNFTDWFSSQNVELLGGYLRNSLLAFAVQLLGTTPLGVFFAFYIFKKMPMAGFFRVMLFVPSVVSALVVLKVYTEFFAGAELTWLSNGTRVQKLVMVFLGNILVSFGTSVLLYANKMSAIAPEVMESAQLDGASGIKEFIYVVFPMIYPTFSVFLITGIASLLTNQLNNFAFYGFDAQATATFGYYLFVQLEKTSNRVYLLPALSALGLMATAVTIPITFIVKYFVTKFGPSED